MNVRKNIGYIMFRINSGLIEYKDVDLLRDPESTKQLAVKIIESQRESDRYANPEHPHYDLEFAKETTERYEEMLQGVDQLEHIALNADDDLIILEVFDYVEFPELEPLGGVSAKMKQQFERHQHTWAAMTEYQRAEFLRTFNDLQSRRSNRQQYDVCAEQGLSYRLVLYALESYGLKNESICPADHSDLLYMEDIQAWFRWRTALDDEIQKHRIRNGLDKRQNESATND